jgi:hypothetical protein
MNRACHLHTTGFDLPDRRIISAVPQLGRGEDDVGAPNVLLRRAAIQHDRLKP